MENSSLVSDVFPDITPSSSESGSTVSNRNVINVIYAEDPLLKVIYSIIGTVGIIGNLFVIIVFFFFIKIADKVLIM